MTEELSRNDIILTLIVVAIVSAVAVRMVRGMAVKRALLDVPNERSSHRMPVPRLGGAAFVPVLLIATTYTWSRLSLSVLLNGATVVGTLALYAISLVDDMRSLPSATRFVAQLLVSGLVVAACAHATQDVPFVLWLLPIAITGTLNIYNFMDGIDGIAGIQGLCAGATWALVGLAIKSGAAVALGCCISAATIGFLTLNWPPAKIFMGDAGSTVLGFLLAVAPLVAWAECAGATSLSRLLAVAVFALWPFLADGTFTILRRLRKRENIFRAHRSHLYQRLVIAGRSHRDVTLAYGFLAAVGGLLACWVVPRSGSWVAISGAIIGILFVALWAWTISEERKAARRLIGHS